MKFDLQYKHVRSSNQHETTKKHPSHITIYATHSRPQQRTSITARKQSQSLRRWQRRCGNATAWFQMIGIEPVASICIKNVHNFGTFVII